MVGTSGPFQIISSDDAGGVESPQPPPRRRYMCPNYATCLDVAGALNWDNFTCRGCSGEIDATLLWRAKCALKKDKNLGKIFKLPEIETVDAETQPEQTQCAVNSGGKL